MNLYAIKPDYSPESPELYVLNTDEEALERGILAAAEDNVAGDGFGRYFSPTATVWLVARDLEEVGKSRAGSLFKNPEWWSGIPGGREELARVLAQQEGQTVEIQMELDEEDRRTDDQG